MDWEDDNIGTDFRNVTEKKPKKTVMIDEKTEIKFINIEREPSRIQSPFLDNVDLYVWPWRIGTVICLIGYLFHVLAYATPFWMITLDTNADDALHVGLWCACATISDCSFRNDTSTCLNAVRTFGGFGIICGIVIIALLIAQIKKPDSRSCLNRAIVTCCFIAALSVQMSSSVFWRSIGCSYTDANFTSSSSKRWAWSLALSFTSVLLAVVAGLVFLIIELISISRKKGSGRAWNGRGFVIT